MDLTQRLIQIAAGYRLMTRALFGAFGDRMEFKDATLAADGESWDIDVVWRTTGKLHARLIDGQWAFDEPEGQ